MGERKLTLTPEGALSSPHFVLLMISLVVQKPSIMVCPFYIRGLGQLQLGQGPFLSFQKVFIILKIIFNWIICVLCLKYS